ncbi:FadR/GntR family transcriptional regulator [Maledivibacter halophilus]|uniref:DNA-binding transcriptional regulator, FadR family n=1 Tax=Maledivibacter halophilus TaxID=36842 RepID=A0A1T5M8D6_9FIRM|nr:FCD domain-containing protein [Maledivibacter halophilus]SKC84497.1 DNA-binding transcriptional regulator, FadR family [Maledivibacter halophilus]
MNTNMSDEIRIMSVMSEVKIPVGAIYISQEINIPQASVGRILKDLEDRGLIKKISNKGRVLTENGESYLKKTYEQKSKIDVALELANLSHDDNIKEKLIEILEVRKILEIKSVELACQNRTDSELTELELIYMGNVSEINDNKLGNEQDLKLHLKIAEMSHNKTLYYLSRLLLTENNAYTFFSIVTEDIKLAQLKHHKKLVESIKNRDVEAAKKTMEEHINRIIDDVEKNME